MGKTSSRYVIIGIITTLIIATIGVTYAYWRGQIQGEGAQVSLTLDKVYILFTDTQEIVESKVRPGWSTSKTFTIENQGTDSFRYDIYIKDLINTLEVDGFFQYKITSDNNGYNMSDYKSIDKSLEASDYDLATGISIEAGIKQTYTIEFRYVDSPDVDQSEDMGKTISGSLMIRENTYELAGRTLYSVLTEGDIYPVINTRTNFDASLGGTTIDSSYDTTGVIYKEIVYKEIGGNNTRNVYYFAGNPQDNWVKFAGFYWRIIRTNEDGSVRLLYAGSSPDTTSGYITSTRNDGTTGTTTWYGPNDSVYNDTRYVGWMYGGVGDISSNRQNTTDSGAKYFLDQWYESTIASNDTYSGLVSLDAIYCNDRSGEEYTSTGTMNYAAYKRLVNNKRPTYKCGGSTTSTNLYDDSDKADKFSVTAGNGRNGKLTYPVGLMTADEVVFAGGMSGIMAPNTYYYRNSVTSGCTGASGDLCSVTGSTYWWTMSPSYFKGSGAHVFLVFDSSEPGYFDAGPIDYSYAVRPVISLKPEVVVTSGNGTSSEPYEVSL